MEVEPRIGTSFVRWVPLDQLKEKTNKSETIKLVKNTQAPAEGGKSCRTLAFVALEPFRGEFFFSKGQLNTIHDHSSNKREARRALIGQ